MSINFSSTTPAAPSGNVNVIPQNDGAGNMSFYVPGSASTVNTILQPTLTANFSGGYPFTLVESYSSGVYRVSWSQAIVQAASGSSTFPSLTLAWTDIGGVSRTATLVSTSSTNTTAVEIEGDIVIYVGSSTLITVTSASYASYGATPMTYALAVVAESL